MTSTSKKLVNAICFVFDSLKIQQFVSYRIEGLASDGVWRRVCRFCRVGETRPGCQSAPPCHGNPQNTSNVFKCAVQTCFGMFFHLKENASTKPQLSPLDLHWSCWLKQQRSRLENQTVKMWNNLKQQWWVANLQYPNSRFFESGSMGQGDERWTAFRFWDLCHIQIFLCLWAVGKPTHCSFIVAWPFLCYFCELSSVVSSAGTKRWLWNDTSQIITSIYVIINV